MLAYLTRAMANGRMAADMGQDTGKFVLAEGLVEASPIYGPLIRDGQDVEHVAGDLSPGDEAARLMWRAHAQTAYHFVPHQGTAFARAFHQIAGTVEFVRMQRLAVGEKHTVIEWQEADGTNVLVWIEPSLPGHAAITVVVGHPGYGRRAVAPVVLATRIGAAPEPSTDAEAEDILNGAMLAVQRPGCVLPPGQTLGHVAQAFAPAASLALLLGGLIEAGVIEVSMRQISEGGTA
jgi:hypothetical protein